MARDRLPLYHLDAVMQELNRKWAQVGIQFFIYGEIDHIYDDTYFNLCSVTAKLDELRSDQCCPEHDQRLLHQFVWNMRPASFTHSEVQGVVLDNNCVVYCTRPVYSLPTRSDITSISTIPTRRSLSASSVRTGPTVPPPVTGCATHRRIPTVTYRNA